MGQTGRDLELENDNADVLTVLRDLLQPSIFWRPDHLALSSWTEHVPFAFWLVETLQPRVFVELGSAHCVSYFAFCQAADRLGIAASCYAVDTWAGDVHTGFYDEDVFNTVSAKNDAAYSNFSSLIRSTFDEALDYFSDGTIDLLHIDGLHTYEAVKHDFETWLPKLSPRAVVIFHDTNVRERGFGVFRFFEELQQQYPAFEFAHGHGLGVVGVGTDQADLMRILYGANSNSLCRSAVQDLFGGLGRACLTTFQLEEAERRNLGMRAELKDSRADVDFGRMRLETIEEKLGNSQAEVEGCKVRLSDLQRELDQTEEGVFQQKRLANEAVEVFSRNERAYLEQIASLRNRLSESKKLVDHYKLRVAGFSTRLSYLTSGSIWRLSAPLRSLGKLTGSENARVRKCIEQSGLFDRDWYLDQNPDVANGRMDPLSHYLTFGAGEGRDPSPEFSSSRYLAENPDVASTDVNPLVHYVLYGKSEGRPI